MSSAVRNMQRRAVKQLDPDAEKKRKERKRKAKGHSGMSYPVGWGVKRLPSWARTNRNIYANVGRNHPDYGLSPSHHWKNKEARRREQEKRV